MASEQQHQQVSVVRDEGFERRKQVVQYAPNGRNVFVSRAGQLIWLITAIIIGIIMFRFVLALIAANPGSPFVDLIYTLSNPLVAPFSGITNLFSLGEGSVIDVPALFALVVYPLLAWVIVRLLRILFSSAGGVRRVSVYERKNLDE